LRSLRPRALGKRRSLRDATRTSPRNTDRRPMARGSLLCSTGRVPIARYEPHASRIVEKLRNRPDRRAYMTKHYRLPLLALGHFLLSPVSNFVRQSASSQTSCQPGGNREADLSVTNKGVGDDSVSDTRVLRARNKFGPRVLPILARPRGIVLPA